MKVWLSLAPSMAAASRRDGSTLFRPARYKTIMYPMWRQLAATRTAQMLMLGSPRKSMVVFGFTMPRAINVLLMKPSWELY